MILWGPHWHVRTTTALFCLFFLQKLWDSGIGLSAWLVRLSVVVVDPVSVASAGAGAASQAESSQPAVVRELKERLFGRGEECHVIELGAVPPAASLLLIVGVH